MFEGETEINLQSEKNISQQSKLIDQLKVLISINDDLRSKVHDLEKSVYRDELTGLYNRRGLVNNRCKYYDKSKHVVMGDIDDFKKINDKYGHQEGDNILLEVSTILKNSISGTDNVVARYGGEEFLIVLVGYSKEQIINYMKKLKESFDNTQFGTNKIKVAMSYGIAFGNPKDSFSGLIREADEKMYEAKSLGKDRYCI